MIYLKTFCCINEKNLIEFKMISKNQNINIHYLYYQKHIKKIYKIIKKINNKKSIKKIIFFSF